MNKISKTYSEFNTRILDPIQRRSKATQILHVLQDFYGNQSLSNLNLLDIGCSSGVITHYLSCFFKSSIGIDTDHHAISIANRNIYKREKYEVMDAIHIAYPDQYFDVIIFSQVYYYIEDLNRLINEIYRVLKPQGVCYFSGLNKINLIDKDLNLILSPVLPRRISMTYAHMFNKDLKYVNRYRTYWQLRKDLKNFLITRYTPKIIKNPQKFGFDDLTRLNMPIRIPESMGRFFEPFLPNFIWMLEKPPSRRIL